MFLGFVVVFFPVRDVQSLGGVLFLQQVMSELDASIENDEYHEFKGILGTLAKYFSKRYNLDRFMKLHIQDNERLRNATCLKLTMA